MFFSSAWVQLWALPLLMVGNNVNSRASDRQAKETHDAVMTELTEMKGIINDLHALLKAHGIACDEITTEAK